MPTKHAELTADAPETTGTTNTPLQVLAGQQKPASAPEKPFSEADIERLRASAGAGPRKFGLSRLPDGSFRLDVTIPVEVANWLEAGAESTQEPLEEYIQRNVVESLQAYLGSNT